MFKVLSICMHACSRSLCPLADSCTNNVLLQTVPDFNEALLQLIHTVYTTFIHSLLHNTPEWDLMIQWIQIWAVGWSDIRTNEIRRFLL